MQIETILNVNRVIIIKNNKFIKVSETCHDTDKYLTINKQFII